MNMSNRFQRRERRERRDCRVARFVARRCVPALKAVIPLSRPSPPTLPLRAVLWSVVLAALGYLGLSLWAGWRSR